MEKKMNLWIKICFLAYFVILITERLISVIMTATSDCDMFAGNYDKFTFVTVFLSLGIFLIFLLLKGRSVFKFKEENPDYKGICIASGILLLSGMVHTQNTIVAIQFVAYAFLIAAILLKTILINKSSDNKKILWLSFAYLICFSMAVPVMYHSNMSTHFVFHLYEIAVTYLLVGLFTFLLVRLFDEEENLFLLVPAIIMVVLDAGLIIWRWQEEINYFVLIFVILSLILFVVGFILLKKGQAPVEEKASKPAPAPAPEVKPVEEVKEQPKPENKPKQNPNPNKGGNNKGKKSGGKKSDGKKSNKKGKK